MKVHSYALSILMVFTLSLSFLSCDDDDAMEPTIVEFAQDNTNFSILVDALTAAGLVDALNDRTSSLTVFAPTNAAFEAFLTANNFVSLNDVPVDLLRTVLLYHVLPTEETSSKLTSTYYNTLAEYADGEPLTLYINTSGGVKINAAIDVAAADEEVANGVIHTVNEVIEPANVVTFATADPTFSNLVAALTRTDLTADFVSILSGDGPFTVFAPTNAAFEALLASNPDWNTLADIPVATLETVLKYHVVAGANVRAADIVSDAPVTTFEGSTFSISLAGSAPVINAGSNTATIVATDVQGTNGVVHAIDTVLLP
ncbi:fasciclin domain-containing protein [Lewinella sp. LCG006]|uniref:fasciclin domain-containing protein n=1 Tax=Lewinella sp. LCG006 TaxID=3231911 RepID=UPI00345F9904